MNQTTVYHSSAEYEAALLATMTNPQRAQFSAEMQQVRRDERTGVLFALLLGGIGAHRFYLNEVLIGLIYVLFFWTFVPAVLAFVEALTVMRDRVTRYNKQQAYLIASRIKAAAR